MQLLQVEGQLVTFSTSTRLTSTSCRTSSAPTPVGLTTCRLCQRIIRLHHPGPVQKHGVFQRQDPALRICRLYPYYYAQRLHRPLSLQSLLGDSLEARSPFPVAKAVPRRATNRCWRIAGNSSLALRLDRPLTVPDPLRRISRSIEGPIARICSVAVLAPTCPCQAELGRNRRRVYVCTG